jgi:hypothetical protein
MFLVINMTYASISEIWGSTSGSNQLSTPMNQRIHPIHAQRIQEEEQKRIQTTPQWKTNNDLYQCSYGSHNCVNVYNDNLKYNEEKKQIAQGTQPYLTNTPYPYTFAPQYPWYDWAKYNYLMYPAMKSAQWYNDPWAYRPDVAHQVAMYQAMHPDNYSTNIQRPYSPQGFLPFPYLSPPQRNNQIPKKKKTEKFTNLPNNGLMYCIFSLIGLAVILVLFMIIMTCVSNNNPKMKEIFMF